MINSLYGKTMENVRNHIDMRLIQCDDKDKILKYAAKPTYKDHVIISDTLIAMHMHKKETLLNKPIYIGASVLDLSKLHMYNFYYDHIIPKYKHENVKLIMTDTDSLLMHIHCEDFYKDMIIDNHLYDLSDKSINFIFESFIKLSPIERSQLGKSFADIRKQNKKVIGKFKEECDEYISEALCIRSKVHAIKTDDGKNKKKLKGIKKNVVANDISFDDYKNSLINNSIKNVSMNHFRSINHQITTQNVNKVALTPYNNKGFILDDGINTLSFGHYRINELKDD